MAATAFTEPMAGGGPRPSLDGEWARMHAALAASKALALLEHSIGALTELDREHLSPETVALTDAAIADVHDARVTLVQVAHTADGR